MNTADIMRHCMPADINRPTQRDTRVDDTANTKGASKDDHRLLQGATCCKIHFETKRQQQTYNPKTHTCQSMYQHPHSISQAKQQNP